MKATKYYIIICMLIAAGCVVKEGKDNVEHVLAVSQDEYKIESAGGVFSFFVEADSPFVITCPDRWVQLSRIKETKSDRRFIQEFSVAPNEQDKERSSVIKVETNDSNIEIKITQMSYPFCRVVEREFTVSDVGGEVRVIISKPMNLLMETTVDWIVLKAHEEECVYDFKVLSNETYDIRKGCILLFFELVKQCDTVWISQYQKDAIILSSKQVVLDDSGGDFMTTVKTNVNYDFTIMEPGWLSSANFGNTRSLVDNELWYHADNNTSRFDRHNGVVFHNYDLNIKDTLYIQQRGYESILSIIIDGLSIENLSLYGDSKYGTIDWGDNRTEDISDENSHTYAESGLHRLEVKTHNVTGFTLTNIVGVQTIDLTGF